MSMLGQGIGSDKKDRRHRATLKPKPGNSLSDDQKRRIAELFVKLKNPSPAAIARRVGRNPKTVRWHMLTHGMYSKAPRRGPGAHQRTRNGAIYMIHPWEEAHDTFIQAQRASGLSCAKVAAAVTAQFGIERKGHSVRVRLVLLAAAPETEAA